MQNFIIYFAIVVFTSIQAYAQTDVTLSVRVGGSDLIGVGIEGFEAPGDRNVDTVRSTLEWDLDFCGLFQIKAPPDASLTIPGGLFGKWEAVGAKIVVVGEPSSDGGQVTIRLIDLQTAGTLMSDAYRIRKEDPKYTAHVIADDIISIFNGLRGCMASQLAFISESRDVKEIFLMDPDGSKRRQVTFSRTLNLSPGWSVDGKNVAYSTLVDAMWAVASINIDTGQMTIVSDRSGLNTAPSYSPVDPDVIAYASNRDGNTEIYTSRRNGGNLRRLTNHRSIDSSPTWSPDGSMICFTSDRTGAPKLYLMSRDGTGIRRLTHAIGTYEDSPCWSPRGDRIAFVLMNDYGSFDIATVDVSGNDMVMLTFGAGSNENPKWSPDGLKIVFTSNRHGGKNLYVMNWDGSEVQPLTNDGRSLSPAWAPTASGNDVRLSSQR